MTRRWQTHDMSTGTERGTLRIYLGAAPGVGKTYAMLGEAVRRRQRGVDVVVGIVETHGRAATASQLGDLEVVPRRNVEHRNVTLSELDVDAVLARRPEVVLIDEYAHTNAPGSRNAKRWQDVEQLLDAGIDVVTTLNVQHLESLNDVVIQITGSPQAETVPDRVVRAADQIELVDMSPEALRRRMAHGNIYPPERADAALANFFRPGNLGALRELALLWVADRVEQHLDEYAAKHRLSGSWETRERVLVGLTGAPGSDVVVRRAARLAQRVGGELIGVHVAAGDGRLETRDDALVGQFALLESLGGTRRDVVGDDAVASLLDVARLERATQIVIGETRERRWRHVLGGGFAGRLSRAATGIDLHIVGTAPVAATSGEHRPIHLGRLRDPRRTWRALAVLAVSLPALTVSSRLADGRIELTTILLLFLALVLGVAYLGGRLAATIAAAVSALTVNFFFVEPRHTLTIGNVDDVVALAVFVLVGLVVGVLVDRTAARSAEAARARDEAAILARTAALLAADPEPVTSVLDAMIDAFGLDGARLVEVGVAGPVVVSQAGLETLPVLEIGGATGPSGVQRRLLVCGRHLSADDQRVLTTLAAQLGVAMDRQAMHRDAGRATELASIDRARTALLRSVSHDLRTPLATIKALASGLGDESVAWSREQLTEMYATIDEEADRLNRLIGNLLDASRLESGSLAVHLDEVVVDEVIRSAVGSLTHPPEQLRIGTTATIGAALADRSLLERSIANLIDNAGRYSPEGSPVTVTAASLADQIHVCVIDRGPGIPADRRQLVLAPFQRLDDVGADGVGLGLAIVDGFAAAMGGALRLDDTPGGGLTATLVLPAAHGSKQGDPA